MHHAWFRNHVTAALNSEDIGKKANGDGPETENNHQQLREAEADPQGKGRTDQGAQSRKPSNHQDERAQGELLPGRDPQKILN